jgi:hypothetical protein
VSEAVADHGCSNSIHHHRVGWHRSSCASRGKGNFEQNQQVLFPVQYIPRVSDIGMHRKGKRLLDANTEGFPLPKARLESGYCIPANTNPAFRTVGGVRLSREC